MIHFKDAAGKKDTPELPSPVESRNTTTTDGLSKEVALDFWDKVFSEHNDKVNINEIDEEPLFSDIFGRFEDEFAFDFEIDEDIQTVLDKFENGSWERLSDDERKTLVGELADLIGKKLGLDEIQEIAFFEAPENYCGAFNQVTNTVEINSANFSQQKELINTIAHEIRHAYQYRRALKQETYEDMLYKCNFENYISPIELDGGKYLFFTDYQDQLIEAEARAFANIFNEGVS